MHISWFTDEGHQFDTVEEAVPGVGALVYIHEQRDYGQPKKYKVDRVDHSMTKSSVDSAIIKNEIKDYPEMQFTEKDDDSHKLDMVLYAMDKFVKHDLDGHIYHLPGAPSFDKVLIVIHRIEVILIPITDE